MHSCQAHCGPVQAPPQHPSWLPELISDFEPLLPSIDSVPLPGCCVPFMLMCTTCPVHTGHCLACLQCSRNPWAILHSPLLPQSAMGTPFLENHWTLTHRPLCCCSGKRLRLQGRRGEGGARMGECATPRATCRVAPAGLRPVLSHRCPAAEVSPQCQDTCWRVGKLQS